MTEPKIKELLGYAEIQVSARQISGILIKGQKEYHAENDAICEAGLSNSPYQHLDDTPARVNGKSEYCQILLTPVYTSYHTTAHKDRLSVLDVLRNLLQQFFYRLIIADVVLSQKYSLEFTIFWVCTHMQLTPGTPL